MNVVGKIIIHGQEARDNVETKNGMIFKNSGMEERVVLILISIFQMRGRRYGKQI